MPKTKEIDITWKGNPAKVVIKKMGYAEKCDFKENFLETQLMGKVPKLMIHPFRMKIAALQKCIVSAPFKTDELSLNDTEIIGEEEEQILDSVYDEIKAFNRLDEDTAKKSDGDSNTEAPTQGQTE